MMKISELISLLESSKEKVGDVFVFYEDNEFGLIAPDLQICVGKYCNTEYKKNSCEIISLLSKDYVVIQ